MKDSETQYYIELGKKFNNIISRYAVSDDELLTISEECAIFVGMTRLSSLKELLREENVYIRRSVLEEIKLVQMNNKYLSCKGESNGNDHE